MSSELPNDAAQEARYPFSIMRERMMEARGPVADFAIGRAGPRPPDRIRALARSEAESALRRCRADETAEFVDAAIALMAREYGVTVTADQVLPTPGGRPALAAVIAALIGAGDDVLVTEPGYPTFARLARERGAHVIAAALDPRRGFVPDLKAVGANLRTCRLAAVNYPNNPTGAAFDDDVVRAIAERLPARCILFNDATYGPLAYDAPPRSLVRSPGDPLVRQPVVELHALSKLFGLGGVPVSFLVGDPGLIGTIARYGEFAWSPESALHARIATLCLRDGNHVRSVRSDLGARIDRLRGTLARLGLDPYPAPAGLYVLCPAIHPVGGVAARDPWVIVEDMLEDHGIAIMPWEAAGEGYLRFSALHSPDDLAALDALGRARHDAS